MRRPLPPRAAAHRAGPLRLARPLRRPDTGSHGCLGRTTVTYLELRAIDADGFAVMAVEFRLVAVRLRDRAESMADLSMRLRRQGIGPAARAAETRSARLCARRVRASTIA